MVEQVARVWIKREKRSQILGVTRPCNRIVEWLVEGTRKVCFAILIFLFTSFSCERICILRDFLLFFGAVGPGIFGCVKN
jgi:hypothetical protein